MGSWSRESDGSNPSTPAVSPELHVRAYDDLHAERVMSTIDEVLAAAAIEREQIDAVASDVGPGSFTGVRVGVAAAKGIALALGAPLVGVPSLAAMAAAAFDDERAAGAEVVLALLDAKRQELFAAAYDRAGGCVFVPCHVPIADVSDLLARAAPGKRILVVGEVAAEVASAADRLHSASTDLPDPAWIARLARRALDLAARGGSLAGLDPALLEPLYVRAPDAKPSAAVVR